MGSTVLTVRKLSAAYGKRRVISDVNLQMGLGDWFCLVGPNASGKSTLLQCISGQLTPSTGSISIAGHGMGDAPHQAKAHLGFAHPPDILPGLLTGLQCMEVYAAAKNLTAFDAPVMELAKGFRMEELLSTFVDTYSLGTRQKLSILLALLGNPQLVILDEAFNGLDPRSALFLKDHLSKRVADRSCAVLLATHSLDIVLEYSTGAGLLIDGAFTHVWQAEQINGLRAAGIKAFEHSLAAADSRN